MIETQTSLAVVIADFLTEVNATTQAAVVFTLDKDLASSALTELRKRDIPPSDFNSIFAWSRSPLRKNENYNYRAPKNAVGNDGDEFKIVVGSFDINWTIMFPDIRRMEEYEVKHVAKIDSLNSIEALRIELGDLGYFDFSLDWTELESVEISDRDIFNYSFPGVVTITGTFVVSKGTSLARIHNIYNSIFDFSDNLIAEINV